MFSNPTISGSICSDR